VAIFAGIRESLARQNLKSRRKKNLRNRKVHNFETAREVSLLFDASSPEDFRYIKEFAGFLSRKNIEPYMLGFIDSKEIPDEVAIREHCDILSKNDLDWIFRPSSEQAKEFIRKEYDILFDLSLTGNFPLSWLAEMSMANFKVGRYTEKSNDYDLMIDIKSNPSVEFLIEQIKNYVSILNQTQ
jgi:hypothetical protein